VIINHFKNQGVDNESRIKKIIEECSKGGVSLEAVMNAFDFMGGDENKKIAKEIKDAIGKVKIASDSKDLSEADLNEVLGITDATPDMVTK
jgi:uncharacterized FAD-dependent dehydrogenase